MLDRDVPIKLSILQGIINTIWFGFWFYLVAFRGFSPWWFLFPVINHWQIRDIKGEDDK